METKKETLSDKQKTLDGLVATIELRNRMISREEKSKTEAVEIGLEFRLAALVERCKIEEIELKIGALNEILEITKV